MDGDRTRGYIFKDANLLKKCREPFTFTYSILVVNDANVFVSLRHAFAIIIYIFLNSKPCTYQEDLDKYFFEMLTRISLKVNVQCVTYVQMDSCERHLKSNIDIVCCLQGMYVCMSKIL